MMPFAAYWKHDRLLRVILCTALVVHVLSALFAFFFHYSGISPLQDPLEYRTIALNVLEHGTFSIAPADAHMPDLLRGPGYPLFLAATFVVDSSGLLAILLQQFLLVLCGALAYLLLRYFSVNRGIALTLTALYLLEPQQWFYSLQTMSETVYSVVFLAAIVLALLPEKPTTIVRSVGIGVLVGLSVLIKPSGILLAPFMLALLLVRNDERFLQRLKMTLIAGAIMAVVIFPWVMRNHALTGDWLLSSSSAYNFDSGIGASTELVLHGLTIHKDSPDKGLFNIAYSTAGYQEVKTIQNDIIKKEGWASLIERQVFCAPQVWFSQSLSMIAGIALGSWGASHAGLFNALGVAEQALLLVLFVAGSAYLLCDKKYRLIYTLLFAMVGVTTLVNVCNSYSRMLIPLFPIIAVAAGVLLTKANFGILRRHDS